MHPFGETVLAWRLARGLTQDGLARAARIEFEHVPRKVESLGRCLDRDFGHASSP